MTYVPRDCGVEEARLPADDFAQYVVSGASGGGVMR